MRLEIPPGGAPLCTLFDPHGPRERRFKLASNEDTGDDERKYLKGAKCKACKKETTETARFVWFGHLGGEHNDPGCGWAKCTKPDTDSIFLSHDGAFCLFLVFVGKPWTK